MTDHLVLWALLPAVVYLLTVAWHRRFKQYTNFPQLKPSFIWGHMKTIHEFTVKNNDRPGLHIDWILREMVEAAGNPSVLLVDTRPAGYAMAVISSHEVAEQLSKATKQYPWSAPKSPTIADLVNLIGPHSILSKQREEWKSVRKQYNPGFAPKHLITLLPCIIDKTEIFLGRLNKLCESGESFPLTDLIISLTFDIIGAVTMGINFDAQHPDSSKQGEFIRVYDQLVHTYQGRSSMLPWWCHPKLTLKRFILGKKVDSLLELMIRQKHGEEQPQEKRSVLSLSLQGHDELDEQLLAQTIDQVKTFLFAGHDTTSILLAWAFYFLHRHPKAQQTLVSELDALFGPESEKSFELMKQKLLGLGGDELLNNMVYTTAVIKETLRLCPPAGTARMTPLGSNFVVRTPEGQELCLDGMVLYNCATIIQRDHRVFGDTADEFMPERWLGDKSGIMSSSNDGDINIDEGRRFPASAWRPFERGPRNCIGQDLATIEARVIIAFVARKYNFTKVGFGELERDERGGFILDPAGKKCRLKGKDVYNTQQVTAKPVNGMLMTVKKK
ncbi:putative cytochrome P450 E-class, group I [Triangularia setosa]|uniref:Cytochrome P450 E-class, group I n=1 Tax=Triangularia setosa TaxID=2587417 RepID=A0AAN7A443_9PEZI|nr:putative cytochrome P450 E-class, group I [Podospora setosa]